MRIIFFGTSPFAATILSFLLGKKEQVVAVVTRPDRPKGRSLQMGFSAVKELLLATSSSLPLFQPEKASTEEFVAQLKEYNPDLFIVVAYGEIIKQNLLSCPALGCINIHASLLPKYRGAAPIQRVLMNGEVETGITIIEMVPQMDAGPMLAMDKMDIPEEMTFGELSEKLCELACHTLSRVIEDFKSNKVEKIYQEESQKTFAPKIMPDDEVIHWEKPAFEIHNQIRALSPFPGAWCSLAIGAHHKRMKIKRSQVVSGHFGPPGTVVQFGKEGWLVACGQDGLKLLEVQLEGKKLMTSEEFIRGFSGKDPMISFS